MEYSKFIAFGNPVPQSEIEDLISQGVNPNDITNEYLEDYYYWEHMDAIMNGLI